MEIKSKTSIKDKLSKIKARYIFAKREILPLSLLFMITILSLTFLIYPNLISGKFLPDRMIINITTENTIGGFITHIPSIFALITPIFFAAVVYWIFSFIPNSFISIRYKRSFEFLYGLKTIILAMLFVFHLLVILYNLKIDMPNTLITMPFFAILMVYVGLWTYRARKDFFLGIRTPWTMRLTEVWTKTNRLGGILFILTGIVYLSAIFFTNLLYYILLVPLAIIIVVVNVYSKMLYEKELKKIPKDNLDKAKKAVALKK